MKHKEELNSDIENLKETSQESEEIQNEVKEALPDAKDEQTDPIQKLEAELTEIKDKHLRLYSDFENYKRRVSKERVETIKMAASDIFLSFLPVIDDLERAMKSIEDAKENESVKEGIKLIYTKIKNITNSKGLKEMQSVGNSFDPELHDAIANIPAPSEKLKGKIIEEVEKGYYLNDKVIRHAKVIVGN